MGAAIAELELRIETASTLILRKVLDVDNPAHRAIILASNDPAALHLMRRGGVVAGCQPVPRSPPGGVSSRCNGMEVVGLVGQYAIRASSAIC